MNDEDLYWAAGFAAACLVAMLSLAGWILYESWR
jgi:hypothetical protein